MVAQTAAAPATKEPLHLVQSIPMPGVQGKFDHSAADVKGMRLFVAGAGNKTLEVLDLKTGKWTKRIPGFGKPQGLAYVAEFNKLFVSDGEAGDVKVFAGDSLALTDTIKLSADADYVSYDAVGKLLYVAHGGADAGHEWGEIAVIDPATNKVLSNIRVAGHPEAFVFERGGARMLVNIPDANHVAVIDRDKRAVISTWAISEARKNVPMALDEANHRLFVGCRTGSKMLVLDSQTGKTIASLPSVGGADDMSWDAERKRVYLSGGEGAVSVYGTKAPDSYTEIAKVVTASGAKTSLFVPELGRFYIAVPQQGSKPAELRIFEVQ